jgi:GLPGLI family protein
MRNFGFVLILLIACRGQAQSRPGPGYLMRYSCVFNEQFDRAKQYLYFHAELRLSDGSSYFFITPDDSKPLPQRDPNSVYFRFDTLLRVAKFQTTNQIVFGDPMLKGKEQFFRDSLFPMHWELPGESREVGSLHCAKATTHFRGRDYVCWYCPDIPVPDGPWKLGGLPGLIVEAYDTEDDLHFLLQSMEPSGGQPFTGRIRDIMSGSLPGYEAYVSYWKGFAKKLEASMGIAESSDCASCQTRSKVKIYLWEKVLD